MNIKKTSFKQKIATIVSAVMLWNVGISTAVVFAANNNGVVEIANENIGKDITYVEKQLTYKSKENPKITVKQRLNIITADMNNKDISVIFSKAKDVVNAKDTVTNHISQEISKGNNIVAGANGDFFNMNIGVNVGPQVRDNTLLVGYTCKSDEKRYPIFGFDNDNKPFMDNLSFQGTLGKIKNSNGNTNSGNEIESTIDIDSVNRFNEFEVNKFKPKNTLMIITPQYSKDGKLKYSSYAPSDALTIIKGINEPIRPDSMYEGTVESVGVGAKEVTIPKDGIVIASNGTKTKWIKNHLKQGDKVTFKVGFNKKGVKELMGTYTYLVKNSKALNADEMVKLGAEKGLVIYRRARTAVGMTRDNKIIAVTVAGGQASKAFSDGVTLPEMANIMLSLGVTTALNLDGGGSTQMNVRHRGETNLKLANIPSDGSERQVTNAILFVNAPKTDKIGEMSIDKKDVAIYKNSSYKFGLKGLDENVNIYNFEGKTITWTVDGNIGKVDAQGIYKSIDGVANGSVIATLDGMQTKANIKVVDKMGSFNLTDNGALYLAKDATHQFNVKAKTEDGQELIIDNNAVKWSINGKVGTIDENGLLTVTEKEPKGEVVAEAGGKKVIVPIEYMSDVVEIENFENADDDMYRVAGYIGGKGQVSKDYAFDGNQSYKITYDYNTKWTKEAREKFNGTIDLMPTGINKDSEDITKKYTTNLRPKKLGMYIYGNGIAPWVRASIIDGKGKEITVDFTKKVDWKDEWRNVYAEIPKDIALPITVKKIYMVETDKKLQNKGIVYLDNIRFIFTDNEDLEKKKNDTQISDVYPSNNDKVNNATPIIIANITDAVSGVDIKDISITVDGKALIPYYDEKTGFICANVKEALKDGKHTLVINAKNKQGEYAKRFQSEFIVENAKDNKSGNSEKQKAHIVKLQELMNKDVKSKK